MDSPILGSLAFDSPGSLILGSLAFDSPGSLAFGSPISLPVGPPCLFWACAFPAVAPPATLLESLVLQWLSSSRLPLLPLPGLLDHHAGLTCLPLVLQWLSRLPSLLPCRPSVFQFLGHQVRLTCPGLLEFLELFLALLGDRSGHPAIAGCPDVSSEVALSSENVPSDFSLFLFWADQGLPPGPPACQGQPRRAECLSSLPS